LKKLVIFGVGLIGGSLALALKHKGAVQHIVGVGRRPERLQQALDLGVIDEAQSDVAIALKDADMVVIATPVAQTPAILQSIQAHLPADCIITDVGSTKSDIAAYVSAASKQSAQPEQLLSQFVGAHPIAGAEKSGVTAAKADLFQGKNVVITPNEWNRHEQIQNVESMWQACGANVCRMSASEHDGIFASVSHLPHLLAFALVHNLTQRVNAQQLFAFAASGFRDFSRIAGSSAEMWRDISLANRDALLKELQQYQQELAHLQQLLDQSDAQALQDYLETASQARNAWAKQREQ
jgi:prephenate dehydrogenase